jgi:hypothetical protein
MRKIKRSEVRGYVLNSVPAMWQKPTGQQIFSEWAGSRSSACMTGKAINFWHEGQLTTCKHTAETKRRYELLLQWAA